MPTPPSLFFFLSTLPSPSSFSLPFPQPPSYLFLLRSLESSFVLCPFPLELYICPCTNSADHLSPFQFNGLSLILSSSSPVISNSHRHCTLELEGLHPQSQNRAQVGWVVLLVAPSGLQYRFANPAFIALLITEQLRGPQHQEHNPLGIMPVRFAVQIPPEK